MEKLAPAIVRIIARYLSGILIALGLSPATVEAITGNPEFNALLLTLIGGAVAAVTEFIYAQARKDGKAT